MKTTSKKSSSSGFTLVDALVSIGVTTLLVGLLLPAAQTARVSARRIACRNNLRQIGLGLQNYESAQLRFPPTFRTTQVENEQGAGASWSIHGRLLPFIEQSSSFQRIDLETDWHKQLESGVTYQRIPTYLCPSEANTEPRTKNGQLYVSPHSYGFNFGGWFIYDPKTQRVGNGAFTLNRGTRAADFIDGMSHTLAVAEVKTYQPYVRNTNVPGAHAPTLPEDLAAFHGGFRRTGHTVWPDGRVHHSGFTTVFNPNSRVSYAFEDRVWDIDFTSQQEGKSSARNTYAAVTARSHHASTVYCLFMSGTVRAVLNDINHEVWQGMGTRAGQEIRAR